MLKYIFRCTTGSFSRTIGRILAYFVIGTLILFLGSFINISNVHAEEYKPIEAIKTSMHTYVSTASYGASSTLVTFSNPAYKEITASAGSVTFKASGTTPKLITKLAINVFGNFKSGKTYKVIYVFDFPNAINLDDYTCFIGSYTNNTAFPPYSKTSCTVRRSNSTEAIIEGLITIEQGQYVTAVITPKYEIDTTRVYDILKEDIPQGTNSSFKLAYGTVSIFEQVGLGNKLDDMNNKQDQTNQKLDDMNNKQDQTNQKLDETNDFLKDDTPPNTDISSLGNVQGLLPPGPLDSLLNIPFDFLSIVTSSLSGTCVPLETNFVFDTTLTYPCFNDFYDNVPPGIMIFVNIIPSSFILILYLKHLYKKVDRAMSLESNADDERGVL